MIRCKLPKNPDKRTAYYMVAQEIYRYLKRSGTTISTNRRCGVEAICTLIHTLDRSRWDVAGFNRFNLSDCIGLKYKGSNPLTGALIDSTYMKAFTGIEIEEIDDCYNYLIGKVGH